MTDLLLVLHAHLPWGHLADDGDAAARWLLEASVDCYQPLLKALQRLDADSVPFRITLSVSPPLAAMWGSPLFAPRLAAYVEAERQAWREAPNQYAAAAEFHLVRLEEPRLDLLAGFAGLSQVELICSNATHGFLPLLSTVPAAGRAQVRVAVDAFARSPLSRATDRELPLLADTPQRGLEEPTTSSRARPAPKRAAPAGMWLAECGYCPGADQWLLEAGIQYFFVEAHTLARTAHGPHAAVRTPAGVAAFARDPLASEQVWSRTLGYPGDPAYLDFHHRVNGLRVLKVPGEGPWNPDAARQRALEHARHFVRQRELSAAHDARLIVAPYDAELFGHWWFEGPDFLEAVLREAAQSSSLRLATGSDHLLGDRALELFDLPASSWGKGGHAAVWLDPANAWIWPHLHRAAERMIALAALSLTDAVAERALAQAARELLLAQASDWPFLLEARTNAGYARLRLEDHLVAFRALAFQLEHQAIDEPYLVGREATNNLFGSIDCRVYGGS